MDVLEKIRVGFGSRVRGPVTVPVVPHIDGDVGARINVKCLGILLFLSERILRHSERACISRSTVVAQAVSHIRFEPPDNMMMV